MKLAKPKRKPGRKLKKNELKMIGIGSRPPGSKLGSEPRGFRSPTCTTNSNIISPKMFIRSSFIEWSITCRHRSLTPSSSTPRYTSNTSK